LFINSVINCRALYPLHSCRLLIKICLLYWAASKLPRLLDTVSKLALFSVSYLKIFETQCTLCPETARLMFHHDFGFMSKLDCTGVCGSSYKSKQIRRSCTKYLEILSFDNTSLSAQSTKNAKLQHLSYQIRRLKSRTDSECNLD